MTKRDSKLVLWNNVSALMKARYGKENLTRLAKDAGIGPGTASRIKEHETSVGIDVLDAIAKAFKVSAWQLLVPGLNVQALPRLAESGSWPIPGLDLDAMTRLPAEEKAKIRGYIERSVEEHGADEANRKAA